MAGRKKAAKKKAPARKKTAKKKTTRKKAPKKPAPLKKSGYRVRLSELRSLAAHSYITDPHARSVAFWHEHPERPFAVISIHTFKEWSIEDAWNDRRTLYRQDLERQVLEKTKEHALRVRFEEIARGTQARDALAEYLIPLVDEQGNVERHGPTMTVIGFDKETGAAVESEVPNPLVGMPKLPLEMPRVDQLITSYIKLEQHIQTMRGETTSRTEVLTHQSGEAGTFQLEPTAAGEDPVLALTEDDIATMARMMLEAHQPELVNGHPGEENDDDG